MTFPAELDRMRQVIQDLHGAPPAGTLAPSRCASLFRGEVVWDGVVEVFALSGHPNATQAYAWSHETADVGRRYVAVLQVPPVDSAGDTARAAIVAEHRAP